MISDNEKIKPNKKDPPIFRMAEMCVGPMSSPPSNDNGASGGHVNHGTAHVHIKIIAPWEKRV